MDKASGTAHSVWSVEVAVPVMCKGNSYCLPFSTCPCCPSKLSLASWCTLRNRCGSEQIWGSLGLKYVLGVGGGRGLFRHSHAQYSSWGL